MSLIKMNCQYISTIRYKGELFTVVGYDSHRVFLDSDTNPNQGVINVPKFFFFETFKEYVSGKNYSKTLVDNETRELLLSILQEGIDDLLNNGNIDSDSASHIFNHVAFSLLDHNK